MSLDFIIGNRPAVLVGAEIDIRFEGVYPGASLVFDTYGSEPWRLVLHDERHHILLENLVHKLLMGRYSCDSRQNGIGVGGPHLVEFRQCAADVGRIGEREQLGFHDVQLGITEVIGCVFVVKTFYAASVIQFDRDIVLAFFLPCLGGAGFAESNGIARVLFDPFVGYFAELFVVVQSVGICELRP